MFQTRDKQLLIRKKYMSSVRLISESVQRVLHTCGVLVDKIGIPEEFKRPISIKTQDNSIGVN